MKVISFLLAFLFLATCAFAGPQEILEKVADKYPAKDGTYYILDEGEWDLISGVTLVENVKGLPIDVAIYSDGDEAILVGLDVNVKLTKNSSLGIGFVAGFDRIENPLVGDFGEYKVGPSVIAKIRF